MHLNPNTLEAKEGEWPGPVQPGLINNNKKSTKADEVAQVGEYLPSKP
jgi:hypothetical protein